MPSGVPVHPEQRARAKAMMAEGKGRNEIARAVGISTRQVDRIAADEGHIFDGTATETAVATRRLSRAARRADIIDRLYDRTEHLLDRIEADSFQTLGTGEYGASVTLDLDYVPVGDEKNVATTINIYLERAARLELVDDGDGVAEADSMLGRLAKRFGLVD